MLLTAIGLLAPALALVSPLRAAEPAGDPSPIRPLETVASPPPVQMFVPGFTVRELPVQLTNINNVLYREDGVLVALAYDGNVYLLRDTDGDGLEDQAALFWQNQGQIRAPIGMALTPPDYARGRGVFVPSKSKLSLLLDADGDDVAEQEVVVATGWRELWTPVDAVGVAVDPRDHSIYFGLGTWNYANGYQVNEQGVAEYRLDDEHGTILRVAPDFGSREIVCTGIRFSIAMRFNHDEELFCTDQEGATWLANGNPFDELLHVQRGRHYGFPPRHPRHLPNVVDEPSLFDYRPQHQSACGLNFNEPAADGTIFGPDRWRHDALVAGYSRGKLYRTKLARSVAGYVAQTQLLATTSMLLSDVCVAPARSLVLAAHSGGPDWGSGPGGDGKLFKVTYRDAEAPLPTLAWAASPGEIRIAFDRPVDGAWAAGLAEHLQIDGGHFVAAGDQFETLRPGYAVVAQQVRQPRHAVAVEAIRLSEDRRTLVVTTAPQTWAMNYAVTLPAPSSPSRASEAGPPPGARPPTGELQQHPAIDLQYDLHGVEATWQSAAGATTRIWLPSVDLEVSRQFTRGSADHDRFWQQLQGAGTLTLTTVLNLNDMLRPAVQPGGVLDYQSPAEQVALHLTASHSVAATLQSLPDASAAVAASASGRQLIIGAPAAAAQLVATIHKEHGEPVEATISFSTHEDSRLRPLPLNRYWLPWADRSAQPARMVDNRDLPELAGGDWQRGKQEFFGAEAGCSKCHAIRGEGAAIGPNLSNLPQRDYVSVLRDVAEPSYAINPDYTTQTVVLAEGRVLAGTVRSEGDRLIIADQEGKETVVQRSDVESIEPATQSIMPTGIPQALGEERMRDLMTFLLNEPPTSATAGD